MAAGTTAVVQLVPRHHPLQFPISKQSFKFKPQSLSKPSLFPISCSSSSPPSNAPVQQPADAPTPIRGCKACGREEVERGCNGEGRIQGGIATVPGFGWWPIKAYRPCPGLVASGGRYTRYGQTMDEVGFGSSVDMAMAKETNSKDE